MKHLQKLFLVVICLIFFACGASHHLRDELVFREDTFEYSQLKEGGLVFGGISSGMINLSPEKRIAQSSYLSNILLEELKDVQQIRFSNTKQLIGNIGRESYFRIMTEYDKEQTFTIDDITTIREAVPNTSFILIAYIENENIIDRSYDEYIETEEGEDEIHTEYEKTYLLTVSFEIFDMYAEKMVWQDVIYNQAERTETRTTSGGCFESCMESAFQTILFGEAADISREEVLAKTAEKMAENLAKTRG